MRAFPQDTPPPSPPTSTACSSFVRPLSLHSSISRTVPRNPASSLPLSTGKQVQASKDAEQLYPEAIPETNGIAATNVCAGGKTTVLLLFLDSALNQTRYILGIRTFRAILLFQTTFIVLRVSSVVRKNFHLLSFGSLDERTRWTIY